MSFTCDYCCKSRQISASQSLEDYRSGVLTLLCEIAAAEGGGGGGTTADITGINGVAPAVGTGAVNSGTLRVTLGGSPTVGLVAGSAIVGSVGIDQTTPGTTNGVQLKAGTAIAGKFGIDQTTPGTTNLVAAGLVAGTALVGKVGIDQTTDGTTNAVHLVAGTALAGKFGIDQTTPGTTNGVSGVAATTGGYTPVRVSGGLGTTVVAIKSSAQGKLGGMEVYNPNTVATFIQIFNVATAGAVTLGTTAPTKSIGVPPLGGAVISWGDTGLDFSAGIQVAATTTEAGSTANTTAITANFDFK